MLHLGERIRNLYVDKLGLLPPVVDESTPLFIRASPYSRALESTHHALLGLYPLRFREQSYAPSIVMRSLMDENLMPNETHCQRFIQMMKAYTRRAADQCLCGQGCL